MRILPKFHLSKFMYQKNGLCLLADDPLDFLYELGFKAV